MTEGLLGTAVRLLNSRFEKVKGSKGKVKREQHINESLYFRATLETALPTIKIQPFKTHLTGVVETCGPDACVLPGFDFEASRFL